MPDIFLYGGEANPNDIELRDPTVLDSAAAIIFQITGEGDGVGAASLVLLENAAVAAISASVGGSSGANLVSQALISAPAGVGASSSIFAERAAIIGTSAGVGSGSEFDSENLSVTSTGAGVAGSAGTLAESDVLTAISAGVGNTASTLAEQAALTAEGDGLGDATGLVPFFLTGEGDGVGGSSGDLSGGAIILPLGGSGGIVPRGRIYIGPQQPRPLERPRMPRLPSVPPIPLPLPVAAEVKPDDEDAYIAAYAAGAIDIEEFAALIAA